MLLRGTAERDYLPGDGSMFQKLIDELLCSLLAKADVHDAVSFLATCLNAAALLTQVHLCCRLEIPGSVL